jgi:hypothetical protein
VVKDPELRKYESFGEILTKTQVPTKLKSYFTEADGSTTEVSDNTTTI